jgi:hypothetical protein
MNYVEWLRVRNRLRTVGIILLVLVAIALALRISVARSMSPQAWIGHLQDKPGAKVTHVTLPGVNRTVIDDPSERVHVVIDDRGYNGQHIVIDEPSAQAKEDSRVDVGSFDVSEKKHGSMTTTVIDTNGSVPMIYYMALADVVALIVATLAAAPFAREIDGHLEFALTKPVSRVRFAIGYITADVTSIVAASVMTVAAFYICQLLFESPRLDFSGVNEKSILMGIALPLAWYALLAAATTWFPRGYGALLGFAWPVVILIQVLAQIHPPNMVTLVLHNVAWVLSRLDPLSYVSFASIGGPHGMLSADAPNFLPRLGMEIVFFLGYSALAIVAWKRVEA